MLYNLTLVTKKDDCDALLAIAAEDKASLEFRKTSLERHRVTSSGSTVDLDVELQTVEAAISVSESIIAGIPDGDTKNKEIIKLKGLDYRKAVLTQRKSKHGVVALMETDYDIGCCEKEIEETDAFIAAINERKNAL